MKNNILICLLVSYAGACSGQNTLKINGGHFMVNGNVALMLHNTIFENDGTFNAGTGTVVMAGDGTFAQSSIGGDSATVFYNLQINKSANGVQLDQSAQVDNELQMTAGDLDLNGHDLTLGFMNGAITGESAASRVMGTAGGELVKTTVLNAPTDINPGNLGVSITSIANLDTITVRRGHQMKTVYGTPGIERYYTVTPSTNDGLDATARFYYFDDELNGVTEANLEPVREVSPSWHYYAVNAADPSANYVEANGINAFSTWTLVQAEIKVSPKVFLQGPFSTVNSLMTDALRSGDLIPSDEPYTALSNFSHVGTGGNERLDTLLFNTTGDDAIVDWVFLQLRDKNNSASVLHTRAALLQRDGDIVGLNGRDPVVFPGAAADNYYLAVRHRNHLGVRTDNVISLSTTSDGYDFSTGLGQVWDNPIITSNPPMIDLDGTNYGLFRADVNANGSINVADFYLTRNQSTPNQTAVYLGTDVNMNGNVNVADFYLARSESTPNKSAHLE